MSRHRIASVVVALALGAGVAGAQPLGTYQWQLAPLCNVVTLAMVQSGTIYTLQGTDDQCGAPTSAAATGLAFVNPNGTIGFGISIVTSPGGAPVTVDASIALPGLSGSWRDSGGRSGTFAFAPGPGALGAVRPMPMTDLETTVQTLQQQVVALELANADLASGNAVIPSGRTVTGAISFSRATAAGASSGSEAIMFPAMAPVALTDTTVNFQPILYGNDGDPACTGSVATPTAPAGKVCLYMNEWAFPMRLFEGRALSIGTKGFKIVWANDVTSTVEYMNGSWAYTAP